ncbi:MAG: toll/interleukin-1 receptor domain-containing protein [Pseudomonadota bacterium]
MKVFISWSGERSKALAQALHDWIPLVLHNVEPWLSEADIEAGDRWAEAVAKELSDSNFGIICVTRENVGSPWVLFEAGALAKSMQGSKVIPLLLDLDFRDITGPLAQFQAKKLEKTGINEVVNSINQTASHAVPESRAKQLFDALWPEFEKKVASIPKQPTAAKHTRPQHEILEELVASVRSLDSRLREVSDGNPDSVRHRRMKLHPMMFREMAHMVGGEPGNPIGLLVLASMFRADMPWLYELAMEAYRASNAGLPEEAARAKRQFKRAVDVMRHGPYMEEMGVDPHMLHMLMRELDHPMTRELPAEDTPKTGPKRKKADREGT